MHRRLSSALTLLSQFLSSLRFAHPLRNWQFYLLLILLRS